MVALGLHPPAMPFGGLKHRPGWLLRVLLTTCVGIPLAALLLLRSPPGQGLSPSMATALMLMAICPSAPLISLKSRLVAGNAALAARLQLCSSCVAILSVPLWVQQLPIDATETLWSISASDVAAQVFSVQVLPLILGMSLRHWCSAWAERWSNYKNTSDQQDLSYISGFGLTKVTSEATYEVTTALLCPEIPRGCPTNARTGRESCSTTAVCP